MLFKTLDAIRQKPKQARDQYALGVAVCCTLLIGGVWSLSLPSRFAGASVAAVGAASNTAAATAPFGGLMDQLKSQFASAKEAIAALPKGTSTPVTVTSTTSAMDQTEAALNMQLSEETRAAMQKPASTTGTTPFGVTPTPHQTIMIATTSDVSTTAN